MEQLCADLNGRRIAVNVGKLSELVMRMND
jgi:hypothetical protein